MSSLVPADDDENEDYVAEDALTSLANFQALMLESDHTQKRNNIVVLSKPKVYEATFTLKPAWHPLQEIALIAECGTNTDAFVRKTTQPASVDDAYCATASEWEAYRNVGRLWRLFGNIRGLGGWRCAGIVVMVYASLNGLTRPASLFRATDGTISRGDIRALVVLDTGGARRRCGLSVA